MKERIKKIRKELDLTQQAFADKIGMKQNTIAQYEMGRTKPSDAIIFSICREFGVNEEWLRTGEGEMFVDSDDDFIEKIDRIMAGEDDARKNIFKFMLSLNDDDIAALGRILDQMIEFFKEKD